MPTFTHFLPNPALLAFAGVVGVLMPVVWTTYDGDSTDWRDTLLMLGIAPTALAVMSLYGDVEHLSLYGTLADDHRAMPAWWLMLAVVVVGVCAWAALTALSYSQLWRTLVMTYSLVMAASCVFWGVATHDVYTLSWVVTCGVLEVVAVLVLCAGVMTGIYRHFAKKHQYVQLRRAK